jgi:oligopeptidase B
MKTDARRFVVALLSASLLAVGCDGDAGRDAVPAPPDAEARPVVVSAPAGDRIDPYYWIRDDARRDPDVLALLSAENDYTAAMLSGRRGLIERLERELRQRVPDEQRGAPWFDGGYWYYRRHAGDGEYPVFARRRGTLDADEEILLDANALGGDRGSFRINGWDVSPDGRRLAWLQAEAGRRQFRMFVKNLDDGEVIDTGIGGVSSVSWAADGRSLFYVENHAETLRPYRVWRHWPGGDRDDRLVHEERDAAFYASVGRTRSERFNYVFLRSTNSHEMRIVDSADPGAGLVVFHPREPGHEYAADHVGDRWLVRTNWQAPDFRIMRVDGTHHADRSAWRDVVAPEPGVFVAAFDPFETFVAVSERLDGRHRLRIVDAGTGRSELLSFDEPAHVVQLGRNPDPGRRKLQFAYTSLTTPQTTWELDLDSGERTLLNRLEVGGRFDPNDYCSHRIDVAARDGAAIPVSLVHHVDTPLDGSAPLYQTGYGAYGVSSEPAFSAARLSLLDRGFVFAIAHVRGGQERGRRWYEQGRLDQKVNTFTDFIDVTAGLVERRWVDGDRVFAVGGSAGGLLVAAVANMAPERYAGIVAHVPFVDVVTTMLDASIPLTTQEFGEWGDPKNPEDYRSMLSYSPYDNVGTRDYPAMLVTTGLWDSQVPYWEPVKWVARLRDRKTDDEPLLLHVDMDAGHGGRAGRFGRLALTAVEYGFVLDRAGTGG